MGRCEGGGGEEELAREEIRRGAAPRGNRTQLRGAAAKPTATVTRMGRGAREQGHGDGGEHAAAAVTDLCRGAAPWDWDWDWEWGSGREERKTSEAAR